MSGLPAPLAALRGLAAQRRAGIFCGVPSFCTANPLVIEACLEQALPTGDWVLIEATANQVNQYGGYTGMTPADFRVFVEQIADRVGFPRERLILGGDHLGPLTWTDEPESAAMEKARELVRAYVLAGFEKIHLDTSMALADDPSGRRLPDETVARRGAALYAACEQARRELGEDAPRPVYVIGSEVPIPGGAQRAEGGPAVTRPEDLLGTVRTYHQVFHACGLDDAFRDILAVVVQPGVEFGDDEVYLFDPAAAAELSAAAASLDGIVLEGHSTDYQTPEALRAMVKAGIPILKVGPALTFALREALFALSLMERELVSPERQARLMEKLEQAMLDRPGDWEHHYHGTPAQQRLKRRYSYSDRSRYYLAAPELRAAVEKLFANLDAVHIPQGMLHQYMPRQHRLVLEGRLQPTAAALAKSAVAAVAEEYRAAARP